MLKTGKSTTCGNVCISLKEVKPFILINLVVPGVSGILCYGQNKFFCFMRVFSF